MILLQVVDAFTDTAFAGNPAAVAFLSRFPHDDWLRKVAREMNLSETAYAVRRSDGDYDLRWFTPQTEVDLCGHATLAAAYLLGGGARFHTRSGVLECHQGPDGLTEMSFPADPLDEIGVPLGLPGASIEFAGRGRFDLLVAVSDPAWLRSYVPDISAIAALDCRGVILTAPGDGPGIDFVSRMFAPSVGVAEDPVTGSAHCTLAGYWSGRTGRPALTGYQASERGGTVHVRLDGDRVVLGGRAVSVSEVRMQVDAPA